MMHFTDITGLAGIAFAIAAFALRLPVAARLQAKQRAWLAGALVIAAVLPFGGLSVAEFVRGIAGDLSIITLALLSLAVLGKARIADDQKFYLLTFVAIAALALYPFALGLGMFDPYRLGFGDLWFIAGLLLVALTAWLRLYTLIALSISLAVLAWSVGWYESNNLWDYLLDPWVSIYALSAMIRLGWVSLRGLRQ